MRPYSHPLDAQGLCCEVTSPGSVARLASVATGLLGGRIDVWINNAGYSGSFQVTLDARMHIRDQPLACLCSWDIPTVPMLLFGA